MGAEIFVTESSGKTAREAFSDAVDSATKYYGIQGYTGSIAEKDSFVMINVPEDEAPHKYAMKLMDEGDERIDDKWGPAGCIQIGKDSYLFFGWASS